MRPAPSHPGATAERARLSGNEIGATAPDQQPGCPPAMPCESARVTGQASSQAHYAPNSAALVQAGAASFPGKNRLTEEETELRLKTVAECRSKGMTYDETAAMLGMTSNGLQQWLCKWAGPRISASFRLSTRKCMCCRAEFQSEGAHNRMCADCRRDSHQLSPLESTYGNSGRQVARRK